MLPGNGNFKNIVKDTNITAAEALERFDLNLEKIIAEGVDDMEYKMKDLCVLSSWIQEALEKGETMASMQERAKKLAKVAFDLGCTHAEVESLLTIYPKS